MARTPAGAKSVETLTHDEAKRRNIPTAEYQSVLEKEQEDPKKVRYARNRDLDPQLVWRGKDEQDWSDLVVQAPPLYIQEKVHPKALIDDLLRTTKERAHEGGEMTPDLFADFNGVPKDADKTEFYQHDQNWSNRMILGDSLQVMASLAEREGLRGKVQCIYFDPPYGIRFNSNFQWSTTSRDVKDGTKDHITREPEQVRAFRDTWRDGIHSYLTYLRDRLTVARDLLHDSGSIFVQISDENVHRVRALMDEVFGDKNFCALITFQKTGSIESDFLGTTCDFLIWFVRDKSEGKYRQLFEKRQPGEKSLDRYDRAEVTPFDFRPITMEEKEGRIEIDDSERVQFTSPLPASGASELRATRGAPSRRPSHRASGRVGDRAGAEKDEDHPDRPCHRNAVGQEEPPHRRKAGHEDQHGVGDEEAHEGCGQHLRRVGGMERADIGRHNRREDRERHRIGLRIGQAEGHAGRERPGRADRAGRGVLAGHDGANAEIDEIEAAAEAEQLEERRADPVRPDNRRDRERAPGDVADEMAADELGAGGAPARGRKGEEREKGRPRRDDIEKGRDDGGCENLRVGHVGVDRSRQSNCSRAPSTTP